MLRDFNGAEHIYIACGYTDLRKLIDGLAALVKQVFGLDPFSSSLFLFCGKRCDRIKALYLSRHRQFGASSEKSDSDQFSLFNEAETLAEPSAREPELCEVEKHYRKRAKRLPDRLPPDLPVETVGHIISEDEQICPQCASELHAMGKEVRRELKLIPATAVIVEHVRYTYACRNCEKNAQSVPILKAPMPEPVIRGSFASPEAVAHIAVQKFVMGSPLYRQEQEWERQGIPLTRQTMSNWLLKSSEDWLEPIYSALRDRLLLHDVLHADETTLQVLHESGKAAQSKSYMWLYRTGSDAKMPIVLFEYQPSRSAEVSKRFQGLSARGRLLRLPRTS